MGPGMAHTIHGKQDCPLCGRKALDHTKVERQDCNAILNTMADKKREAIENRNRDNLGL